ncbi:MAG: hypothetical protein ABIU95_10530 [Burkholderiales bacterium]
MTTVQIELPDQLAEEAQRAGLLTQEAIERLMREAIRRQALTELKQAKDRMAATEGAEMTPEEIAQEITAARAERRARDARATGA